MTRFVEMVEDFRTHPPLHEIGRVHVLLPGDKGYPKEDQKRIQQSIEKELKPVGKEPEWMRNARLKIESRRNKKHG